MKQIENIGKYHKILKCRKLGKCPSASDWSILANNKNRTVCTYVYIACVIDG